MTFSTLVSAEVSSTSAHIFNHSNDGNRVVITSLGWEDSRKLHCIILLEWFVLEVLQHAALTIDFMKWAKLANLTGQMMNAEKKASMSLSNNDKRCQ